MNEHSKDTEVYRKIIRSQNCGDADICEVIKLLIGDNIISKPSKKSFMWFMKNKDDGYRQVHECEIRDKVFPKLITLYNQTVKFLLESVINDQYEVVKPHYFTISEKLLFISRRLTLNSYKNTIMRELAYMLCNV